MRKRAEIQWLLALVALAWPEPAPARACVTLPRAEWHGYPRDGAENVPLDAVPVYWATAETQV